MRIADLAPGGYECERASAGVCGLRNEILKQRRICTSAAITVMVAAVLILSSCSKEKQAPPRTVPVVTAASDRENVPLLLKAIGNVESYNSVAVKSQVGGEISGVLFREGQDVKKGDLLFKIDPRPFEAALRQAESALLRDRAQAKNAQEDAKRYVQLSEKGYVSRQEYDRVKTNAEALDAVVQADEAVVENARLQLAYTSITAPIDGRTGTIAVNRGNVVKANDIALVTINQITPIYVSFSVPEQELANIQKFKASGELHVSALSSQSGARQAAGALTFIDNKVNTATGTILLKASFPNHDHSLWPGQFVDVVLTLTTEKNRTVVPQQAVQTGQQGQFVFVIKEDKTAEVRQVTVARTYENWAIIEKGVQPGEQVVIDGQLRLAPGVKVEIKNANSKKD
jgi:multidrug efflux system membrane fusion protein